jgi:fibronectin type 3 domain-containing protein
VQGYRVYYGTSSRTYLQNKGSGSNVGAATSYVVTNLTAGRTYYFSVTAYDAAGNESDYSSEATRLIN